jgi:hydroxyacylglutathione hydrolase
VLSTGRGDDPVKMSVSRFTGGRWKANCYLITSTTGESLIIDPGAGAAELVERVRTDGLRVLGILCTHGHFDHVEAGAFVQEQVQAPLLLHSLDSRLLRSASLYRRLFEGKGLVQTPVIDRFLDEAAQPLQLGPFSTYVWHTPGHTQGSVSFGIESGLFTGDTLFRGKVGRTDLPGGDSQALAVSLELLAQMPGDPQVFPGHGDRTTIEAEVASNPRLKSLRDAVIAAAHSGGTS